MKTILIIGKNINSDTYSSNPWTMYDVYQLGGDFTTGPCLLLPVRSAQQVKRELGLI